MTFRIDRIDHVVINCRDVEATAKWYHTVLGMSLHRFGSPERTALQFGEQKINLRPTGARDWFTAAADCVGSEDLCFITTDSIEIVIGHLRTCEVEVIEGPVEKQGALGPMTSVYCRDLDGNLIEIAHY